MYDIILKNCKIVNENAIYESDVAIKNARIELIQSSIDQEAKQIIDIAGRYLLPGLIDDQVHFRAPGLTHKAEIATESAAAVAGGITSFMEMPNVLPPTVNAQALEEKFLLASKKSVSNYSFYLGASHENIEDIKRLDAARVCGVKVFMGASTGNLLVDDPKVLESIFPTILCFPGRGYRPF